MLRRRRVLINALHTTTGGGLTYLAGILPELAKDERFEWWLLAPQKTLEVLAVPGNVAVKAVPEMGFWRGHAWEQAVLPFLCVKWRVWAVLCNANYVPLFALRAMPIVHTTPRAMGAASGWRMRVYWKVLGWLTSLSLWSSPVAFSVARHVLRDYVGERIARRVRIAPPGVELPDYGVTGLPQIDENLVVTIGDFYAQKDYPLLIDVLRRVRARRARVRLMIVGRPVDGKVRDEVLRLVRDLRLADAVTLPGPMAHAQLMKTLARAAVYVSTSKAECFNIPVLEALAHGVPCVLPGVDFQREVAGGAAVYVKAGIREEMAEGLARAIVRVMEDKDLREGLAEAGRARAAGFTWKITADTIRAAL